MRQCARRGDACTSRGLRTITGRAQTSAAELAHDIAEDPEERRGGRTIDRSLRRSCSATSTATAASWASTSTFHARPTPLEPDHAAPRGFPRPDAPPAQFRHPLGFTKLQAAGAAQERPIEIPVDLKGPWKATLVMKWVVSSMAQIQPGGTSDKTVSDPSRLLPPRLLPLKLAQEPGPDALPREKVVPGCP